jgi:predicted nucleotidyltransferase
VSGPPGIHGDDRSHPELEEVLERLRALRPALRQRYGVRSLAVFGSLLRGQQTAGSDIDLLVEFEAAPTLFQFSSLRRELSQHLGRRVDLVMRQALRPTIGRRIVAEAMPV